MRLVAIAVVAFGLSWGGVAVVRQWAARHRLLDVPNPRSSHTRPTPRGGGLAIVVTVCSMFLVSLSLDGARHPEFIGLLLAQLLVAGVGLADDIVSLSSGFRLVVHAAAAAVLLYAVGHPTSNVSDPQSLWHGRLVIALAVIWLVGLTNVYNFMDGIDGIAAGQAVVAGVGWTVVGWWAQEPSVGLLGLLLASASGGFLVHNWPPARIFMGDVGSGFLGFSFGALAVVAAAHDPIVAVSGALLVWPFLFDTSLTLVRRLWRGENPFRAHRSHLYQRLVIAGAAHREVTMLYVALAGGGVVAAIALSAHLPGAGVAAGIAVPSLALVLWRHVRATERSVRPDRAGAVGN